MRSHSGTKRSHPSDEADAIRPYKNSLPRIDRPTQTASVDSSPVKEQRSIPRNSSAIFPSFRSVSACNRCRIRKNRCDQRLPRCNLCEKAGVHCVGFDPITKHEIPRSYVFFLESRVVYLERLLADNGIEFAPPEPHEGEARVGLAETGPLNVDSVGGEKGSESPAKKPLEPENDGIDVKIKDEGKQDEREKPGAKPTLPPKGASDHTRDHKRRIVDSSGGLDSLVSKIGMVSVHGASDSRYLGSTSGISFARVVFAAVRSSVSSSASERVAMRPSLHRSSTGPGNAGSSMRDSFFGLQSRPSMKRAPFPDSGVARRLVDRYFEYANPQAPILHRGEFMELYERVYSTEEKNRSPRDLYTLNIVCAIGAGIIFDVKRDAVPLEGEESSENDKPSSLRSGEHKKPSNYQYQPEEYHASAILHLESCLSSPSAADGFGGGLQELQAVLLLASFALLRPVAPGLWYIVGVAVRLAIDLGLHHEDGTGLSSVDENATVRRANRRESVRNAKGGRAREESSEKPNARIRDCGRREWVRETRRRLWWSVYSFDRLVSTCVGRPFGITDQVITTEFPSLLDDKYITTTGFRTPPAGENTSYKHVAHHYFKLRLLQSEIQQVLQYQHADMVRKSNGGRNKSFIPMGLPSPFLQQFGSFRSWRKDVHRRLDDWIQSAPTPKSIGVQYSVQFLELNYWQALTMLYRQSLTVPAALAADLSRTEQVMSPSFGNLEDSEDEDEIFVKVAEAGQKTLRLYRQLHRLRLVNYTYLATHHLFMAGISFLYAIWHSPVVRSLLTLDEVDFTVLGATSVLEDLMEKCPPAEACRDAFERMSKATVQMCLSTTGFGPPSATKGDRLVTLTGKPRQTHTEPPQNRNTPAGAHPTSPTLQTRPAETSLSPEQQSGTKYDGQFLPNNPRPSTRMYPSEYSHSYKNMHPSKQVSPQSSPPADKSSFSNLQPPRYSASTSSYAQQQQYAISDSFTTQSPQQTYSAPPHTSLPTQHSDQSFHYLAGLDFLNITQRPEHEQLYSSSIGGGSVEATNNSELDMFSMSSLFGDGGGSSDTGVDLEFGMTVGLQHEWSEATGYGLFGGFFFGNSVGGS
ncbi:hypothetical protein PRK78_000301 [Emydomyces testavorans]|uniref:Zn(2)-C6 fungal-type domain-containing protein n=1 Tax=Emydomyces testavorans TaxID=2070801 RepID=A0AAF0DB33_9EURO|nr:hypothetical protein PRK78_000301 [Emydomyces testavorans]